MKLYREILIIQDEIKACEQTLVAIKHTKQKTYYKKVDDEIILLSKKELLKRLKIELSEKRKNLYSLQKIITSLAE